MRPTNGKSSLWKRRAGIFLLFSSMALFYWGYHASQSLNAPVAGLFQKDNGTRSILYIDIAGIVILLAGGYLVMEREA